MSLLNPFLQVNSFFYKSILQPRVANQEAEIYHTHSECSAIKHASKGLISYYPEAPGNHLKPCVDCKKLMERDGLN